MNTYEIIEIKNDNGDLLPYITAVEKIFLKNGFQQRLFKSGKFFKRKNTFCKPTLLLFPNGQRNLVIEWADNEEDVLKNITEDGDLYSLDQPIDSLLDQVEKELQMSLL